MTFHSTFTITDDFNSPADEDGTRTVLLEDEFAVRTWGDRYITPGLLVVVVYDETRGKYGWHGQSVMALVEKVEIKGNVYWVTYRELDGDLVERALRVLT